MALLNDIANPSRDPLRAVIDNPDAVLAVVAGVEGPSYRPVGAMMAVAGPGRLVGSLSSGCIEADIALHAADALAQGVPAMLRYGRGSPFVDIQLPCGGGLDILLLPRPDREVLQALVQRRDTRQAATLAIGLADGAMTLLDQGSTGRSADVLRIRFEPELRFLIFGKGPEAVTFAGLVQAAGYPNMVLSPDPETREAAEAAGSATRALTRPDFPDDLAVDDRTAITLFFHDHEWEPPVLAGALETPAFYVGAQGSQRARDARNLALEAMGVAPQAIARLHGPVGLIPSTRDPGTLAVSVLAEILSEAMA